MKGFYIVLNIDIDQLRETTTRLTFGLHDTSIASWFYCDICDSINPYGTRSEMPIHVYTISDLLSRNHYCDFPCHGFVYIAWRGEVGTFYSSRWLKDPQVSRTKRVPNTGLVVRLSHNFWGKWRNLGGHGGTTSKILARSHATKFVIRFFSREIYNFPPNNFEANAEIQVVFGGTHW